MVCSRGLQFAQTVSLPVRKLGETIHTSRKNKGIPQRFAVPGAQPRRLRNSVAKYCVDE